MKQFVNQIVSRGWVILALLSSLASCNDESDKKQIICWGDSLTMPCVGRGYKQVIKNILKPIKDYDISYPNQMRRMLPSDYCIVNCGVGGDNTLTVMGRQGSAPLMLAHDVTIHKKNPVFIGNRDVPAFKSTWDSTSVITPLIFSYWKSGGSHVNPVRIDGKEAVISSSSPSYFINNKEYYFEYTYLLKMHGRRTESTHDTLKAGTIIETQAMRDYRNAWCNVFFVGQNGGYRDAAELIEQFKTMIKYSQCDRFVIVSHHVTNIVEPDVKRMSEVEDSLKCEFGNRYINLRVEMVNHGLQRSGLKATAEDIDSINNGQVPPQLLSDGVHFNKQGYNVVAQLVSERIKKLYITNDN